MDRGKYTASEPLMSQAGFSPPGSPPTLASTLLQDIDNDRRPAPPTRPLSPQSIYSTLLSTKRSLEAIKAERTQATTSVLDNEDTKRQAPSSARLASQYYDEPDPDDWAVYNSFNNPGSNVDTSLPTVPTPASPMQPYTHDRKRQSMGGSSLGGESAHLPRAHSGFGFHDGSPQAAKSRPGSRFGRKSLLTPELFGFDAQNSNPQRRTHLMSPGEGLYPETDGRKSAMLDDSRLGDDYLRSSGGNYMASRGPSRMRQYDQTGSYDNLQVSGKPGEDLENPTPAGNSGVELITVPALGKEYSQAELTDMKRTNQRRMRAEARKRMVQKLARGETRWCGNLLDNRTLLFVASGFLAALGLTLFFIIPRFPIFELLVRKPIEADPNGQTLKTNHMPTNFSADILVNLRADNMGGFAPTRTSDLKMEVWDMSTHRKIGSGALAKFTFPGRKVFTFQMPVHIAYASINTTGDPTWTHWVNACGPKYPGTPRQALNLRFGMDMNVKGIVGRRGTGAQLSDIECPFVLQPDET